MKMFKLFGLFFLLMVTNQLFAQYQVDNPNLDQVPRYLRETMPKVTDLPTSTRRFAFSSTISATRT